MPLVSLRDNDYTLDVADFEESYPKYQSTTPQLATLTQNALLPTNIDSTAAVEDVSVVTCDTLHHSTEGNHKNSLKLSTMTYSDKGVAASTYYSKQWTLTSNQSQGIRQSFVENNNKSSSSNSNNNQIDCNRSRGGSSKNMCSRSNQKEQEREDDTGNKNGDHQQDDDNETLNHFKWRHDSSTTDTTTSVSTLQVNNNSATSLLHDAPNVTRRNSFAPDCSPQKPLASDGMHRNSSFATTGDKNNTPQINDNIKNIRKKKGSNVDLSNFFSNNNNHDHVSTVSKGNATSSTDSKQISISQANCTIANENNHNDCNNDYVRQLEEKLTKLSLDLATCRSQLDVQRLMHQQSLINSDGQLKEKDRTIKNLQEKLYMIQQMHQTRSSAVVDPYHKAAHVKTAVAQQRIQQRNQHIASTIVEKNSFRTCSQSNSYSSKISSDVHDIDICQDGGFVRRKNRGKQEESRRASWISVKLGSIHFNESNKSDEQSIKELIDNDDIDSEDIGNDDYDNDDPFATYSESRRAISSMSSNSVTTNENIKKQRNWLGRSLPWGNYEKKESSKNC